jgi:hypothetical protein
MKAINYNEKKKLLAAIADMVVKVQPLTDEFNIAADLLEKRPFPAELINLKQKVQDASDLIPFRLSDIQESQKKIDDIDKQINYIREIHNKATSQPMDFLQRQKFDNAYKEKNQKLMDDRNKADTELKNRRLQFTKIVGQSPDLALRQWQANQPAPAPRFAPTASEPIENILKNQQRLEMYKRQKE